MTVVLKDFYADWCGPCKQMDPILKDLESELADKDFELEKIDVDADQETANEYQVRSLPTLIIEADGEMIERFVGVASRDDIEAALNDAGL